MRTKKRLSPLKNKYIKLSPLKNKYIKTSIIKCHRLKILIRKNINDLKCHIKEENIEERPRVNTRYTTYIHKLTSVGTISNI